jgi:hypothetical protein
VYALPLAGLCLGWLYERFGASIAGGNNLVLDTMHVGGPTLPLRMAPMVLLGTVATHLFGGSAGREGTAVQMGASLADALASRLQASPETRRRLLAAGIAGGFGSVFGTPVAGAVFAMEVGTLGRVDLEAMVPAVTASVVGDLVCRALGTTHAHYPTLSPLAPPRAAAAQVGALRRRDRRGGVGVHRAHPRAQGASAPATSGGCRFGWPRAASPWFVLWRLTGTDDVPWARRRGDRSSLSRPAPRRVGVCPQAAVYRGDVGRWIPRRRGDAALLRGRDAWERAGPRLGVPIEMGAAVGLAAVFAAASNTPIALVLMVTELVGAQVLPHALVVCTVAYVLVGHRSIYVSQRVAHRKDGGAIDPAQPLPALTRRAGAPVPSETAPTNPPTRSEGR